MSVTTAPKREKKAQNRTGFPAGAPPPLQPGDHLSRAEFERRYQAHPDIKKAELVEGVVYMPSPVRHDVHGQPHIRISGWLTVYVAATPGVDAGDNSTVRLDFENEVQPDAFLRLEPALGGKSHLTEDGYLEGPPELIVEIAASSASYDRHQKQHVYARSGVQEYLVFQMYEQRLDWFVLREGVYENLQPDDDGIYRSEVFPGLWLAEPAFWEGDLAQLLAVVQEQGVKAPEYAAFVKELEAKTEQEIGE